MPTEDAKYAATEIERLEWDKLDGQARNVIRGYLDQSLLMKFIGCKSSKELWDKIDACMAPEGDTHAAALEGEFDMLLLADCKNNMEEFLDRLE